MINSKSLLLLPFAFLLACVGGNYRNTEAEIETITSFDAVSYLGTWYEIARYPNWFEEGCIGVTAQYTQRDDGEIDVLNTCYNAEKDNAQEIANGVARIEGVGKLSVTFTPNLPFIRGDYWILGLKEYDLAVVGNPSGSTGWILARTAEVSTADLAWAKDVLSQNGYDTSALIMVDQSLHQ